MTRPKPEKPSLPWEKAKEARRILAPDDGWSEAAIGKLRAACANPRQLAAVDDPSDRVTLLCPRGAGKTTTAVVKLLIRMLRMTRARVVFAAVTREHATNIIWEMLKALNERLGLDASFAETRRTMTLRRNGSQLIVVGADDKKEVDKLRGIAFDAAVIDEAASHKPELLEILIRRAIAPRLGERKGWLMLTGTPGHDLRGLFYDATRPGGELHRRFEDRDQSEYAEWVGWSSHHWTLRDQGEYVEAARNLWEAALVEKARNRWSDDHPVWRREYLGLWAADDTENVFRYRPYLDDGAEWNVWDPPRVGPMRLAELPDRGDWLYAYAFDMGHADPCAVNVFAFSPSDPSREIFHVYGFEKTEFYARRLAELLIGEELDSDRPAGLVGQTGWPVGMVGDADQALLAELANVYGIRAVAADRRRDYKFGAIELVNGDLVDGRIKILKGSKLEEQMMQLQWVPNEFGELRENKAQANHSTDTLVYGRRLIAHLFDSGEVGADDRTRRRRRAAAPAEEHEDQPQEDYSSLLSSPSYDEEWYP